MILADEPTGNLDRKNSQEIVELLKRSNRTFGQTIFMVTHDGSIGAGAQRLVTMEDGRIIGDTGRSREA